MRERLLSSVEDCSGDVARTEAVLDEVERGVRQCPHVFAAFDRDPASYDAKGMRDAASDALGYLRTVQSSAADVFAGTGVSPTFDQSRTTFSSIAAILSRLPSDEEVRAQASILDAMRDGEREVAAHEAELASLLGSPDVGTDAITRAASGLHALRASFGMSSLTEAEGTLADLLGERSSLAELRATWSFALDDLGLERHDLVDPAAFVLAAGQVAWLGTETLLACRRLPASGGETLAAFAAACVSARSERDALVEAHGDSWTRHTPARTRRAADILSARDEARLGLATEFAASVGVSGPDAAVVLTRMASCLEALNALDNDVQAARVLGAKFLGSETDVASEAEALDRWSWLVGEPSGREHAAIAAAVRTRDPGEVLSLERGLARLLLATSLHEESYGPQWYDHCVDAAFVAALSEHIAAIHDAGARDPDAFDRVFAAFSLTTRLERARAEVARLSLAATPRLDDVRARLLADCRDFLERLFPEATFDDVVPDPVVLHASAVAGRDAVAGAVSHIRRVNVRADFPVVDLSSTIAEASDRLPLLLDGVRISDARLAWMEAHEALDRANATLQGYDASLRARTSAPVALLPVPSPQPAASSVDREDAQLFVSRIADDLRSPPGCVDAVRRLAATVRESSAVNEGPGPGTVPVREVAAIPALIPLPAYVPPVSKGFAFPTLVSIASVVPAPEEAPVRETGGISAQLPRNVIGLPTRSGKAPAFPGWGLGGRKLAASGLIPDVAVAEEADGAEWVEEHLRKVQDAKDRRMGSTG